MTQKGLIMLCILAVLMSIGAVISTIFFGEKAWWIIPANALAIIFIAYTFARS